MQGVSTAGDSSCIERQYPSTANLFGGVRAAVGFSVGKWMVAVSRTKKGDGQRVLDYNSIVDIITWYLDVERPICHLSLLPILLNCVRSHVDLYCLRSVRVSCSSDR